MPSKNIEIIARLEKSPAQGIRTLVDTVYLYNPDAVNELIDTLNEVINKFDVGNYNSLEGKPVLDTSSEESLLPEILEVIKGTVKLHRVSKTGNYLDLLNKPDFDGLEYTTEDLQRQITENADNISTLRAYNDVLVDQVYVIESKIPSAATSSNQLADKAFVNSSVNNMAAFYVTYNTDGDAFPTKSALEAGPYYFQGALRTPSLNDYAIVIEDETHNNSSSRYMYDGVQWDFQYIINNTAFTQEQVDALNSTITAGLVNTYNAHVASRENPHNVTKYQVGLENVDNTSDMSKPVSTATRAALDLKADKSTTYTKTEVDNRFAVANAQIDVNSDAIQKTREDYIYADSEIHQILNSHADELTALRGNQASLGDQVAGIEEKIPESASGSNPLITKQQLLDEEMDIREDLNSGLSELQTQITAQAAAIANTYTKQQVDDKIADFEALPDQTGNAGKVLTTDGTTASWQEPTGGTKVIFREWE